ncbi:DEAD/DEAH box helicase [bacterium]|nr:DEAD/DEAH box helicase [bacterium]MBP9808023.1 DEAD/DEAH box helicase [bacterium]
MERPGLKYFDKVALHEGFERHSQGRVISFSYDEKNNSISGKVHGSQPKPYVVSVFLKPSGFDVSWSLCTCDERKACKHGAALIYAFFDFDNQEILPGSALPIKSASNQAALPGGLHFKKGGSTPVARSQIDKVKESIVGDSGYLRIDQAGKAHLISSQSDLLPASARPVNFGALSSGLANSASSATGFATASGSSSSSSSSSSGLSSPRLMQSEHETKDWSPKPYRGGVIDLSDPSSASCSDSNAIWKIDIHESKEFWFGVSLGIEVEGETIALLPVLQRALSKLTGYSAKQIESLGRDGKFFGRLEDGRILILPFARVKAILTNLVELLSREVSEATELRLSLAQINAVTQDNQDTGLVVTGSASLTDRLEQIRKLASLPVVAPPKNFNAELRPYQLDGLSWLQGLARAELSGILADDMGLGKTVQILAHLALEHEQGLLKKPVLVVCPTSVLHNWLAETKRFAPQLNAVAYHGGERQSLLAGEQLQPSLIVTTYALLIRDAKELAGVDWQAVILDEAQAIKNAGTKAAKAARSLKADYRLCVSGTPVENHLGELWSLFEFLTPGMLGDVKAFSKHFRTPIEKQKRADIRQLLAKRLSPFILRRIKEQVARDLPDKTVIVHELDLSSMQRDLYETVRTVSAQKVLEEINKKGLNRAQLAILDAMLKLRQVCCDPRLVKLAVSQTPSITDSAKLEALIDLLEPLIENGRRILVFSQFTSMLDLIAPELESREIKFVQLRGDTTDRVTPVARFQAGEVSVFLISLKAGGTGLNLTAADTVVHYDPWWNPAVEDQATDRAHRIGQTEKVFVYKFIARGTIEERMLELQVRKRALCEAIFDAESAASISFSEADLEFLFQPLG